jgi:hypothetical protein
MSETQSQFIEPKRKFRKTGPNPVLYHLVTEHFDCGELIFTYKYWSKRWQCWMYETKTAKEYDYIWKLEKEFLPEVSSKSSE